MNGPFFFNLGPPEGQCDLFWLRKMSLAPLHTTTKGGETGGGGCGGFFHLLVSSPTSHGKSYLCHRSQGNRNDNEEISVDNIVFDAGVCL